MDPSRKPTLEEPNKGKGLLLWSAWVAACLAVYVWNIPPHAGLLRNLAGSFHESPLSWGLFLGIWLDHLKVLAAVGGLLAVFQGTGIRCLRASGFRSGSRPEEWVWSLALGWIFWGLLAEALAFENLFFPRFLGALEVAALAGLLVRDRMETFRRCWPLSARPEFPSAWKVPLAAVALLSLANLLAPEMSWDAMTYQLILPRFYFIHHGFYPVTGMVPAHYPSLGQMFFSWGLLWGNDSVARALCFLAHLATALALVGIGTRLESPKVGWAAAVLYWVFPYLNIYSTRGYVDLFTNFYAALGLGFLVVWATGPLEDRARPALGFLASVALGATWGLKYDAVGFWAAGVLILWMASRRGRKSPSLAAVYLLGPAFFFLPWGLKSWAYVHDPVFPYFPHWFHAFGWTEFDQRVSAVKFHFEGWRGLLKLPAVLWGVFFHNYSGAPNEEVSLAPLALAPLLLLKGRTWNWKGPFLVALLAPFVFWLVTSHQLRLISAVIAFFALLAALGYARALHHWASRQRAVNLLLGGLLWVSTFYLFQGLVAQPDPFANFLGFQSRDRFLSDILRPEGIVPLSHYLNANLPKDAGVLILGQQNGYYLDRVSAYDFDYTTPVLKKWSGESSTPEALYRKFREHGFTHILYNAGGMMGAALRADTLGVERYPWKPGELRNYEQFFLRYTRRLPLPVGNGYSLYEVGPREGFSPLPDFLPGTENYYLKDIQAILGLTSLSDLVGRSIPSDVYEETYRQVSQQHPEIGWPCFQWAFAALSNGRAKPPQVLAAGKEGYGRNGDRASWDVLRADVFLSRKKTAQAIPLLEAAQYLSPEREDVARNLAVAYYNEHRFERAVSEARRAAGLAPFSEDYRRLERQFESLLHSP